MFLQKNEDFQIKNHYCKTPIFGVYLIFVILAFWAENVNNKSANITDSCHNVSSKSKVDKMLQIDIKFSLLSAPMVCHDCQNQNVPICPFH